MFRLNLEYILPVFLAAVVLCNVAVPQKIRNTIDLEKFSLSLSPVPWVGVLLFKENETAEEAVAGVILIKTKMAIINARDLDKIKQFYWTSITSTTNIMFLTAEKQPWYATVVNYTIHPEFNVQTLTTIGLLKLEYEEKYLPKNLLSWPSAMRNISYDGDEIFVFGFTDRMGMLEQIVYRMDHVVLHECRNFYVYEELDTQWMRPTSYHCYKVRSKTDSCVFEPGMALVHHANGVWTLLGMSTLGPGCSLPARFLDFEYFIPWIESQIPARSLRRSFRANWYKTDGTVKDQAGWILTTINDSSIVLTKVHQALGEVMNTSILQENCIKRTTAHYLLMHKDEMTFRSGFMKKEYIGVYGFSLYDRRFNERHYTCISLTVFSSHESIKLWYTKSHEQDSTINKKRQQMKHNFIEDPQYHKSEILKDVTGLMFRVQYVGTASLEVSFYGNRPSQELVTRKTTTISSARPTFAPVPKRRLFNRPKFQPTTRKPRNDTTNWWHKWWRYT